MLRSDARPRSPSAGPSTADREVLRHRVSIGEVASGTQHVRAIAVGRLRDVSGNVGPRAHAQLREILAVLLDL